MLQVCQKLKWLKKDLRGLSKALCSNISERVATVEEEVIHFQNRVDLCLNDISMRHLEKAACERYISLSRIAESIFKQKLREQWLTLRDKNTGFYSKL